MKTEVVRAGKAVKKKRKRLIILSIVLLALVPFAVWALYSGLTLRTYEITSEKVPAGGRVRIVSISDLHNQTYGENQHELLDMIKEQNPDIIALTGDIVDYQLPLQGAKQFLEGVADIAPVYYVTGNNEYWLGKCESIKEMVSGYGITVLTNEREYITVNGAKLCICGIDDPEVFKYTDDAGLLALSEENDILKKFSNLDGSALNILLAHRPERIDIYRQYDFDLVLSGHAHGGQVRIPPILNGLAAPDQGLFPRYAGGPYSFDGMTMIVSRGLSLDKLVPRVFDPPEVVVVDIGNTN